VLRNRAINRAEVRPLGSVHFSSATCPPPPPQQQTTMNDDDLTGADTSPCSAVVFLFLFLFRTDFCRRTVAYRMVCLYRNFETYCEVSYRRRFVQRICRTNVGEAAAEIVDSRRNGDVCH
jgi:hypothetical protein